MKLTLKVLEKREVQAIADNPSTLIQHMNKLGKNTIAQNKYISEIVTYLYNHKGDNSNNNDVLASFIEDWFDDYDIHNIHKVVKRTLSHENKKTEWIAKPTKYLMRKFLSKGYEWVSGPYNARSSITPPRPIGLNDIVTLLWDLNDKQDAYEEIND